MRRSVKVRENEVIRMDYSTIPEFSELVIGNSFDNNSSTECITTPIVDALDIMLKSSLARALLAHIIYFLEKCKHDTNLFGIKSWHLGMVKITLSEIAFFSKFSTQFFSSTSETDPLQGNV